MDNKRMSEYARMASMKESYLFDGLLDIACLCVLVRGVENLRVLACGVSPGYRPAPQKKASLQWFYSESTVLKS